MIRTDVNPILKKLGMGSSDRALVIHADDLGMCQATITAFDKAVDFGLLTSGSVMAPCPWFLEMAAWCRAHPDADVGVHATVTSEWKTYRWGPMTTSDPASGLIDEEGYFYHRALGATGVDLDAVELEVRTQIDRALAAGIDVTHVDQHMLALGTPRLLNAYLRPVLDRKLPPILTRDGSLLRSMIGDQAAAEAALKTVNELIERGAPAFDSIHALPLDEPLGHVEVAKRQIDSMGPGLHMIILHPADDTPELRAITPHSWAARVANLEAMISKDLADFVKNRGVQLIGYRPLCEIMRADFA